MITIARPISQETPHFYYPDGRPVWNVPNKSKPGEFRPTTLRDAKTLGLWPSPTTVVKILHRHLLVQWMIEQAVLAAVTTPKAVDETLDQYIHRVINVDRVQDEERNAAAAKGSEIHRAIQCLLDDGTELPDAALMEFALPVRRSLAQFGRVSATEKVIVGDGYAGMTDCITEGGDFWVWDFKTSRNIPDKPYDEHKLQVSAYSAGLGNTGDKRVRCGIIYISTKTPGEIKVYEVENWQSDYKRFRLLLEFWKLTNGL